MSNETSALPAESSVPKQPQEEQGPAIRIVPHIDGPRSLHFDIIEREVPETVVIKIGRFTDKTLAPNRVTFKSKVVSRGHAEIWTEGGKFYIRDTKSSSGTFLNHVRLSAPSAESKPFELNDGDVVQLGVDYQGGTEEIYRCVKMRIELNRSWQRQANPFSLNALKQFKQLTSPEALRQQTTDCCICLCGIGPCQALFLAPCCHIFHYKCIRPLLVNHHPGFLCPLCRSFADLEAQIDNPVDWEQLLAEQEEAEKKENEDPEISANKENIVEQSEQLEPENGSQNAGPSTSLSNIQPQNVTESPPPEVDAMEIDERLNSLSLVSAPPLASKKTSAVPIPRNRKMSNSSDDGDDQNLILGRTLPSSPPTLPVTNYIDENQHQSLREQGGAQRLDEIIEEDEGSVGSSSPGKNQNPTTPLQESSCSSASMSGDDDAIVIENDLDQVNDITTGYVDVSSVSRQVDDSRVKGKGVDRLGTSHIENQL
ncbi:5632_t:CDS:2 [Dentiscutata erythropus]|uniref:5632_t:CDS:1 n=1 Tax=Dentiscutata erythropus TaxID=1348616 RepID=A0A9N9CLL3_9GLOM|nr:5632_t:CDS:2 [Dentiscutata erythropus]